MGILWMGGRGRWRLVSRLGLMGLGGEEVGCGVVLWMRGCGAQILMFSMLALSLECVMALSDLISDRCG